MNICEKRRKKRAGTVSQTRLLYLVSAILLQHYVWITVGDHTHTTLKVV